MYENGLFMFSNEDLELVYRRKKFKIYGETLGATHDVISLLYALEKNYNSILAYEKVLINEGYRFKLHGNCNTDDLKRFYFDLKKKQNNNNISDLISDNDFLIIDKVNFNSPGFWEVIGNCNPLRQIRKYIEERHERQRDKKYNWEMDKMRQEAEIEEIQLHNDMMRLTIIKEMKRQLQSFRIPDEDARDIIEDCYKSISLLNTHIEAGRINKIEEIDDNKI